MIPKQGLVPLRVYALTRVDHKDISPFVFNRGGSSVCPPSCLKVQILVVNPSLDRVGCLQILFLNPCWIETHWCPKVQRTQ
jgi:hypothetical protein